MLLKVSDEHAKEYAEIAKFFGLEDARDGLLHGIKLLKMIREAAQEGIGIMLVPPEVTDRVKQLGGVEVEVWR